MQGIENNLTIKERLHQNGISRGCLYWRMLGGMSYSDALSFPKQTKEELTKLNLKYIYKGRPAIEVARENGIKDTTFWNRKSSGWNTEKACTVKPQQYGVFTGVPKRDYNTILARIRRGWSKHLAILVPIDRLHKEQFKK